MYKFIGLALLIFGLAACGLQKPSEVLTEFTDADIEQATHVLPESTGDVGGDAPLDAAAFAEVALAERALSPQGTVTDTRVNYIYYIERFPSSPQPWRAKRKNLKTGAVETIYAGTREIQAIGGAPTLDITVLSMRETPTGDLEIYRLIPGRAAEQLTRNSRDDKHASMSSDGRVVAWTEVLSDPRRSRTRSYEYRDPLSSFPRSNTLVRHGNQPSVSPSGSMISYVRHELNGSFAIEVYSRSNGQTYSLVRSPYVLEHPSTNRFGNDTAWLEHTPRGQQINVREVRALGSTSTVRFTKFAPDPGGIKHPHLSSGGAYVVYGKRSDQGVYLGQVSSRASDRRIDAPSGGQLKGSVLIN